MLACRAGNAAPDRLAGIRARPCPAAGMSRCSSPPQIDRSGSPVPTRQTHHSDIRVRDFRENPAQSVCNPSVAYTMHGDRCRFPVETCTAPNVSYFALTWRAVNAEDTANARDVLGICNSNDYTLNQLLCGHCNAEGLHVCK